MPTSNEDLQKQQATVQALREQVAEEEAKRVKREADAANDVTMTQLEAEEAALRGRLAIAKENNKAKAVKDGADAPLSAAKDQLAAAVAAQKAAESSGDVEGTQVPTSTPPEEVAEVVATLNDKQNGGNR